MAYMDRNHLPPRRSFSFNRIGDDGACALAAALPQIAALQNLSYVRAQGVAWGWGWEGWRSGRCSAHTSHRCTHVQHPHASSLDDNRIGSEGARALAAALPECTSLQDVGYIVLQLLRIQAVAAAGTI